MIANNKIKGTILLINGHTIDMSIMEFGQFAELYDRTSSEEIKIIMDNGNKLFIVPSHVVMFEEINIDDR